MKEVSLVNGVAPFFDVKIIIQEKVIAGRAYRMARTAFPIRRNECAIHPNPINFYVCNFPGW